MAGSLHRRPAAENDLVEIWVYVAREDERAADGRLGRIERALPTLADNPLIGRARPGLRAFVIESVRVLGGVVDVRAGDVR